VENLCISIGMKMPRVNIIEDDSLNAFASGINPNTYTVSLSRGIIDKLNDQELEAVIAHELTHIRNRDVRLLIISIIFVGSLPLSRKQSSDQCVSVACRGERKQRRSSCNNCPSPGNCRLSNCFAFQVRSFKKT